MRVTTDTELHRTLNATLDSVVDDHAPVIITRDHGKSPAVLMSFDDFSAYEETKHLLRSPANAARLLASIAEFDRGGGRAHDLIAE